MTLICSSVHRFKVTIKVGLGAFDASATPMSATQKPAGAVVGFPKPRGATFMKPLGFTIKIPKWILILLNILFGRRELAEGEFLLDEEEMKNTYLDNGVLMWRGRRLMQIRAEDVSKVEQASYDKTSGVRVASCTHVPC